MISHDQLNHVKAELNQLWTNCPDEWTRRSVSLAIRALGDCAKSLDLYNGVKAPTLSETVAELMEGAK